MRMPVFDLHCDTATSVLGSDCTPVQSLRSRKGHIDLERGNKLSGYAQMFAVFTTPDMDPGGRVTPEQIAQAAIRNMQEELERNKDLAMQARTAGEIQKIADSGKIAAIFSLEGPAGIGFDPGRLEELYHLGFRMSTLGWNEKNVLTGSHKTGGGLTDLGKEYVRECQRLGILVDVSHISDEGFWDIMDITQAPVVASHSNSRSVCNVSRNLSDDMYRQICATGGTVGINLYTNFLAQGCADLDSVCDHVFHFLDLDPSGEHLSLGGDLDGCDALPAGFTGIESYDTLADRLLQRGLDERTLRNLYWNNAMGVMEYAVRIHQKSE